MFFRGSCLTCGVVEIGKEKLLDFAWSAPQTKVTLSAVSQFKVRTFSCESSIDISLPQWGASWDGTFTFGKDLKLGYFSLCTDSYWHDGEIETEYEAAFRTYTLKVIKTETGYEYRYYKDVEITPTLYSKELSDRIEAHEKCQEMQELMQENNSGVFQIVFYAPEFSEKYTSLFNDIVAGMRINKTEILYYPGYFSAYLLEYGYIE